MVRKMADLKWISIFQRKRDNGWEAKWYYQVTDPDTHKRDSAKSVMELAKKLHLDGEFRVHAMRRSDATSIVSTGVEKGIVTFGKQVNDVIYLIPYVENILDYAKSPWVKSENARKVEGDELSERYVLKLLRCFQMYAKPLISHKMLLNEFRRSDALALQEKMNSKGISASNNNSAIAGMRTAFEFALSRDLIEYNPMSSLKPFKTKSQPREILSRSEANAVIAKMKECQDDSIKDKMSLLAVELAIRTGMRSGEIRALKPHQITEIINTDGEPSGYYKIDVNASWNDTAQKITLTKGKYNRSTVISSSLAHELLDMGKQNPYDPVDGFIYWAAKGFKNVIEEAGMGPVTKNSILEPYYAALDEIGISEEKRKQRRIDMHQLRHFYDTAVKDEARKLEPLKEEIRAAVGHKSKRVDEMIYTHDSLATLLALGIMSDHLLDDVD